MNLVKYVRQNFCSSPKSNSVLAQVPVWLRKLFPEMFMMISHSLAVCHEQGIWVEISCVNLPVTNYWVSLLSTLQLRTGSSHLASSVDWELYMGFQTREWLRAYQCLVPAAQLFLCPSPWPWFHTFPSGLSVCLLPTQTLGLCKNGRHTGFTVSCEFLETENPKAMLRSLPAKPLWVASYFLLQT